MAIDDCASYIYCNGEDSFRDSCPESTYFDDRTQECAFDDDGVCLRNSVSDLTEEKPDQQTNEVGEETSNSTPEPPPPAQYTASSSPDSSTSSSDISTSSIDISTPSKDPSPSSPSPKPSSPDIRASRELESRAINLSEEGKLEEALEVFQESLNLAQRASVLNNRAQTLRLAKRDEGKYDTFPEVTAYYRIMESVDITLD